MECDWDTYEVQLALRGERSRPKLAYLDGVLELMSSSPDHEEIKAKLGSIIDAYLVHAEIVGRRVGGPTMRRRRMKAGADLGLVKRLLQLDSINASHAAMKAALAK